MLETCGSTSVSTLFSDVWDAVWEACVLPKRVASPILRSREGSVNFLTSGREKMVAHKEQAEAPGAVHLLASRAVAQVRPRVDGKWGSFEGAVREGGRSGEGEGG